MTGFWLPRSLVRCKKCGSDLQAVRAAKAPDGWLIVCRTCTRATVPPHSFVEHILETGAKHAAN